MKALITGMNGTVAPVLAKALVGGGYSVSTWDRTQLPIDDRVQIEIFLDATQPDCFLHLATGPAGWAEQVAHLCAERNIKFLFTSTVSVYSSKQQGPFSVDIAPIPDDDYGKYKLECEQRILSKNPNALIVRLGWQIGTSISGNHMVAQLEQANQSAGFIEASTAWYPACSFLEDTAAGIKTIVETQPTGLYHLGGNPGLTYFEIVTRLNRVLQRQWEVRPTASFVYNNRLIDPRIAVQSIAERLK